MITRNMLSAATLAAALVFAPLTTISASTLTAERVSAVQDDEPSAAEESAFNKGQNLYIQQRYEQSAAAFRDFLKTYPNSVITDLILLWLGRSYMQLGQLQEAEQVGQRLRSIRETPFIEIYDSELQAARVERQRTAAATQPTPAARPASTPAVEIAVAVPTPTPARLRPQTVPPRQTPTLSIRPTPTPTPEAPARPRQIAPRGPTAAERRAAARRAERDRRINQALNPTTTTTTPPPAITSGGTTGRRSNTNTSASAVRTPVVPRPTPTPTRPRRETRDTQVASVTPPRSTPVVVPTPERPAAVSSDPALTSPLLTSPSTTTPDIPAGQSGGLTFTVRQVPNLNLALRSASLAASPGQPVQLQLSVTNTGNKEDQFRVETDLPAEFQPTFSHAQDGTDTGLPILITPQLARGATFNLLLNIRIPENAADNQQRRFFVRAASQSDNQIMRVADASLTVVAAALAATTGVSQESVMPGETFTQTISVRNQGSAAARSARADFVFNPDFELVSANPSPLQYDRASRTAIWSLGNLDSREGRDITVTLRAVPDALANTRTLGRGTMRTASLTIPSNFDGPSINIGRVSRARIDAVSAGLTATPGDTIYIPFVVRNPGNYAESYNLSITAPGAPSATIYADSNGDGRHQDGEPAVSQTTALEPRGGQFPLLLRIEIPRNTPDRQQFAYNLVTRAASQNRIAGEASTVLTVATPRVRVRTEQASVDVVPGETLFYRLVLVNEGGGLAKNLTVNESLPEALEFVSSEPSLSTQDAPGGAQRFAWRVTELAPGDTTVLQVTVRVRPSIRADDVLSPRHTLTYQDTNGNSYTGQ